MQSPLIELVTFEKREYGTFHVKLLGDIEITSYIRPSLAFDDFPLPEKCMGLFGKSFSNKHLQASIRHVTHRSDCRSEGRRRQERRLRSTSPRRSRSLNTRTLLLDADPQGNATSGVGIAEHEVDLSLYDVLVEGRAREVILPVPGLPHLVERQIDFVFSHRESLRHWLGVACGSASRRRVPAMRERRSKHAYIPSLLIGNRYDV